jgi:hypothetical protein
VRLIFRLRGPSGDAIDYPLDITAGGMIAISGPELRRPITVAGSDTLTIEVPITMELRKASR